MREELKRLWELTGEIGCIAEADNDERLGRVYEILSEALQYSLDTGLIDYRSVE